MQKSAEHSISFTHRAWIQIVGTVNDISFDRMDADMILDVLRTQITGIPFCEYLKRYLYLKAGLTESFSKVPEAEYVAMMLCSFDETGTPSSMSSDTTRLTRMIPKWLAGDTIRRETMLLLGFGLAMTEEDVNNFLLKALHQQSLDPDDPLEAICAYCYRHGYRYAKVVQLQDLYNQMITEDSEYPASVLRGGSGAEACQTLAEDREVLRSIFARRNQPSTMKQDVVDVFFDMYDRVQSLIARKGRTHSPRALEKLFCASIPMNSSGNLVSSRSLEEWAAFARKRLSRQHIQRILDGRQQPTRYDLTSLHFLIYAAENETETERVQLLQRYLEDAGCMLRNCHYGEMISSDPNDAFLMMSMASVDPLGTYSDVMEKVYAGKQIKESER